MKPSVLTAFLTLSLTVSYCQFTRLNSHQVRAILKDHAELELRREQSRVDSVAYQDMARAYFYKDSAFQAVKLAQVESDRIAQDFAGMYHEADRALNEVTKEVRRQKRLRWLVTGGAVILILLAL